MNDPSSAWPLRPARTLTLLAAALLLNACGTNAPSVPEPEPEPALSIAAVNPVAAVAGATVVVTGEGFGQGGSVLIGDVLAHTVSWTEDQVEVVIPQAALPAWQPITVASSDNGEDQAELFVGVEFTGAPAELQTFLDSLPAGTHVLLPAGELDLAGQTVVLDGLHLHGAPAGTSLAATDGDLEIVVGLAAAASLNDLRIDTHGVYYRPAQPDWHVHTSGWVPTAVGIHGVHLNAYEVGGPSSLDPTIVVAGALALTGSTVTTETSAILPGHPRLHVADSTVVGENVHALARFGSVSVQSAQLLGVNHTEVNGVREVTVVDSTVRASFGGVRLSAMLEDALAAQLGEPSLLRVAGSVVEALADAENPGKEPTVAIAVRNGALELVRNERIHARYSVHVTVASGTDVVIDGNQEISNGRTAPGDPSVFDNGRVSMAIFRYPNSNTVISKNIVRSWNALSLRESTADDNPSWFEAPVPADIPAFTLTDNDFAVSGPSDVDVNVTVQGPNTYACTITGNQVTVTAPGRVTKMNLACQNNMYEDAVIEIADNIINIDSLSSDLEVTTRSNSLTSEFVNNQVTAPGPVTFRPRSSLHVDHNQFQVSGVHITTTYPSGTTTFSNNSVVAEEVGEAILTITAATVVEVLENDFQQLGTTSPNDLALDVVAAGPLSLSVLANEFVNLGRALRLYSDGQQFTADINDNIFDFPITYLPAAAEVAALNSAQVALDLNDNRWGQVTTVDELLGYMFVYGDDSSALSLELTRVLTE